MPFPAFNVLSSYSGTLPATLQRAYHVTPAAKAAANLHGITTKSHQTVTANSGQTVSYMHRLPQSVEGRAMTVSTTGIHACGMHEWRLCAVRRVKEATRMQEKGV